MEKCIVDHSTLAETPDVLPLSPAFEQSGRQLRCSAAAQCQRWGIAGDKKRGAGKGKLARSEVSAGLFSPLEFEDGHAFLDGFGYLDLVKRLGIDGRGILVEDHEVGELAHLD